MGGAGVWTVKQLGTKVGEVVDSEPDMPWIFGRWVPTKEFEGVRSLFDDDLQLLEAEDWDAWEELHQRIVAAGVTLHDPPGRQVGEFILHIDKDAAWFRWMDA